MKLYSSLAFLSLAASTVLACHSAATTGTANTTSATLPALDDTRLTGVAASAQVTPMVQGKSAADVAATQAVRRAILADTTLSAEARNVSVATYDGLITLRGAVKTLGERGEVSAKAIGASGTDRVDDDLDVEATP